MAIVDSVVIKISDLKTVLDDVMLSLSLSLRRWCGVVMGQQGGDGVFRIFGDILGVLILGIGFDKGVFVLGVGIFGDDCADTG